MTRAILLFSGGQDSTTCLFYALSCYELVATMGFAYGQRHAVELSARRDVLKAMREEFPDLAAHLGPDTIVDIPVQDWMRKNALTGDATITEKEGELPSTFVPARNLLFLCHAAALAWTMDCDTLIIGVSEADYSGYPDCREETMQSMEKSLSLGLDREIRIVTPLMHLSKADEWKMLQSLGGEAAVELVRSRTQTCYRGERGVLNDWGYGCGTCPACRLRRRGWEEFISSSSGRS